MRVFPCDPFDTERIFDAQCLPVQAALEGTGYNCLLRRGTCLARADSRNVSSGGSGGQPQDILQMTPAVYGDESQSEYGRAE